jgi:uncharacterized protein with HEPN domain
MTSEEYDKKRADLDYKPCMEVKRELSYTFHGKDFLNSINYKPESENKTTLESTASFDKLIRDYEFIGELINRDPDNFRNGIAKLTYNGVTYNMRNKNEVEELKRIAIHYILYYDTSIEPIII